MQKPGRCIQTRGRGMEGVTRVLKSVLGRCVTSSIKGRRGICGRGLRGGNTLKIDVGQQKIKNKKSNSETGSLNVNFPNKIISEERGRGTKTGFVSLKKVHGGRGSVTICGRQG